MLKCVEFFSGIGGLHYAVRESGIEYEMVAAFDINAKANEVYQHNHSLKPSNTNLEHLSVAHFNKKNNNLTSENHLWLLSPPCQPYTRGGKGLDDKDPRAAGLLHLIECLRTMVTVPKMIFLENVLNFEKSNSRNLLCQALIERGYEFWEFLVSPLDAGIPNNRLRYYLCAIKRNYDISLLPRKDIIMKLPIEEAKDLKKISLFLDSPIFNENLLVPERFLDYGDYKHDIVHPEDTRSTTFTKAYASNYIIGTGSFLQTKELHLRTIEMEDKDILPKLGLRFFSVHEVARLHGMPDDFEFPSNTSMVQKYRLLGNSLNVIVVKELLLFMFSKL